MRAAEDIRRALPNLPDGGITTTYEHILRRIATRSLPRRQLVYRTISWLLHSKEIFTTEMMLQAIAASCDDRSDIQQSLPSEDDIVTFCEGLVVKKTIHGHFISAESQEFSLFSFAREFIHFFDYYIILKT